MAGGMTINELKDACEMAITKGYGDRHILISSDDEGNHFHDLYYEFTYNKADLKEFQDSGAIDDIVDLDEVVMLG